MLASGSTTTSSPAGTGVTQARPSRPFTRIPHVPHEAWKQEWRNASVASCWRRMATRASRIIACGPTATSNVS